MVQTHGMRGGLLRESLEAAARSRLNAIQPQGIEPSKAFEKLVGDLVSSVEGTTAADKAGGSDLASLLRDGLSAVQQETKAAENLDEQLIQGQVKSFEELATQLKRTDLTFRFSLEIRNRLVDAYREVMRMTV
ncbi:MAG: flagellar hook-basal body complex protein FliE [Planctomycetota bacterium]|jgi:flagellar hook-basal body complex protein FliE